MTAYSFGLGIFSTKLSKSKKVFKIPCTVHPLMHSHPISKDFLGFT